MAALANSQKLDNTEEWRLAQVRCCLELTGQYNQS